MNEKNNHVFWKSFFGCLLAILLFLGGYYAYDKIYNYTTIVHIEKYESNVHVEHYGGNVEIICQEGIDFYTSKDFTTIYPCHLNYSTYPSFTCSTAGKICLIKWEERVRK